MAEPASLSIADVSKRTGIPVTTLRFYERELSGLFHIRRTAGGHRRYAESDVARFATVRRLTETEGLGLAEVRRAVLSRGEGDAVGEALDRLAEAQAASAAAVEAQARRLRELEARVAALEAPGPRRGWLRRGR
ncbi:MAG TPA: MerR family transcriptional regulator [Thermoanaerobaculia bacterium]|nr:MerR family transcriptional regulator [Thermoanaerobaculia bacterium]